MSQPLAIVTGGSSGIGQHPVKAMRRVATPGNVAGAVLFFAGPAARFVTVNTLWVDRGVFSRAARPYP